MIRKGIAASSSDIGICAVGEICTLKCSDTFVCQIGCVDLISDIFLCRDAVKAVLKEELCTKTVREMLREVELHDVAD